jgi:ferric-dicitrate binding protein FerR (iron transport regulator)
MTDVERVELNELCSAAVDGILTGEQRDRLQMLLRESSEARRFYVRSMQLSASLHSYAAEMQSEPADEANIVRVEAGVWQRWLWPAAAAAAFLAFLWVLRPDQSSVEPVEGVAETDYVARLTGSKDCEWIGAGLTTGDEVAAGQRLDLKTGFAELTFDSGAQLMVHGPAQLDVRSAWEAELQRGTLKANVPKEAIGFRVVNAAVDVVDLGTEFSITANEDGAAEVFVLTGAVEVHPRDGKGNRQAKAVLREKQARRFAKAGPGDVHNREQKFQQLMRKVTMDRLAKPLNYARWSFDEGQGAEAAVKAPGQGASALKLGPAATWPAGQFGSAVEFDGSFTAQAQLNPPLRRGIRTLAFWARVPADGGSFDGSTLAAFGAQKMWGGVLELGWNHSPGDGVVGALRFHAPVGRLVGSTSLRDGRWHHVTVVLGSPGKAGRPPLKLYVDGRLEPFSGRNPGRRSIEVGGEEPVLWVGGSPRSNERFRGMLDELIIADQPLTPQEIRHLMRSNALLSPEAIAGL